MTTPPTPQILRSQLLGRAGGHGRQLLDGASGRQGQLVLHLRLGQKDTFVSLNGRGELLITAPDADRYFLQDGHLYYQTCCPEPTTGETPPTGPTTALDFDPADFRVGQDFI